LTIETKYLGDIASILELLSPSSQPSHPQMQAWGRHLDCSLDATIAVGVLVEKLSAHGSMKIEEISASIGENERDMLSRQHSQGIMHLDRRVSCPFKSFKLDSLPLRCR
jgi:hypothetical protein